MAEREDEFQNAQYIGHLPVYGLMLNDNDMPSGLSMAAILCYGVMKSFGPVFKAGRKAVADRMAGCHLDTVSRAQKELQEFGLLEALNTPGRGEYQRWRILEPNTARTRRVAGKNGYLTNDRSLVSAVEVAGFSGTEALKETPNTTPIKIKKKSKWVNPSRVLHLRVGEQ